MVGYKLLIPRSLLNEHISHFSILESHTAPASPDPYFTKFAIPTHTSMHAFVHSDHLPKMPSSFLSTVKSLVQVHLSPLASKPLEDRTFVVRSLPLVAGPRKS